MSTLETLEKLTQAWPQAEREELGRQFGIGWTARRYQGTGSMAGLEFLYPFLNDSDAEVRRRALEAVAATFHGTGAESLDKLSYIAENRDQAAPIIGQTLHGEPLNVVLDALGSSFSHRNNFIRGLGSLALGLAGEGRATPSPAWGWPSPGRETRTHSTFWSLLRPFRSSRSARTSRAGPGTSADAGCRPATRRPPRPSRTSAAARRLRPAPWICCAATCTRTPPRRWGSKASSRSDTESGR